MLINAGRDELSVQLGRLNLSVALVEARCRRGELNAHELFAYAEAVHRWKRDLSRAVTMCLDDLAAAGIMSEESEHAA